MLCMLLGGSGFLGQNLCRFLNSRGESLVIYGRKSERGVAFEKNLHQKKAIFKFFWGDFEEETAWEERLAGVKTVFHLISTTKPSNVNLGYEFSGNVQPSVRLFEACAKLGVKIIFFSSGGTVYGMPHYLPIDEQHLTDPISGYGISKLAIEKCLAYYGHAQGLDYRILRISNSYGRAQNPEGNQGLIAVALAKALRGQCIEIWGSGNVVRDYIYVDDLMEAVLAVMNYEGDTRIFNVSNARGYSVREIVSMIQSHTRLRVAVKYREGRIQDVPINILSHAAITEETGWQPRVTLDEGIKRMICTWNAADGQFDRF